VDGLAHGSLEINDGADAINLKGAALTEATELAAIANAGEFDQGTATARTDGRSDELYLLQAGCTKPASEPATADAAGRKEQVQQPIFDLAHQIGDQVVTCFEV